MRTRVAASVTGAITLFLASCDGTEPGDPDPAGSGSPSPGSEATESSSHAKYGAPSVADPLEVQGIISHPCSALTKDQLSNFPGTLDGDTHTTETTLYSDKKTSCNWSFQGDRYSLGGFVAGVALPHDRFHGLSSLYRANKKNKYKTFHPIETAGYPAVINSTYGTLNEGDCRVSVGLRNNTSYRISIGLLPKHPDYDQPCEQAKKLASFVVENLKEAQ